jgi:hypothetical protein
MATGLAAALRFSNATLYYSTAMADMALSLGITKLRPRRAHRWRVLRGREDDLRVLPADLPGRAPGRLMNACSIDSRPFCVSNHLQR